MAKITSPLFSLGATGTLGKVITFDKRGIAHKPNAPGLNRSNTQGNTRQVFLAASRALQRCQPSVIAAIIQLETTTTDWRASMVQQMIGPNRATWNATINAWRALA